jgi:hypothetical protein
MIRLLDCRRHWRAGDCAAGGNSREKGQKSEIILFSDKKPDIF